MNDTLKGIASITGVAALAFAGGFWWFYGGGEQLVFGRNSRFSCTLTPDPSDPNRDVRTVNYHKTGNANSQPWLYMVRDMGDDWNTTKRCDELARRLSNLAGEGLTEIDYETDEAVPGQYVLCGFTEHAPGACQLLITLAPGEDPEATLKQLINGLETGEGFEQNTAENEFEPPSWTLNVRGLL